MTDVIAGRFALCDPIARGGSGVVWRAWDRRAGQFCAAKVLRHRDAGDLLRFVREQSVRMSHQHVLTPYSWAAEDEHVVIASELIDGGSLDVLLSDYGPLADGTIAAVLDQLLQALDEVHAAGLVHRDVKPGNVLLRATRTGPLQLLLGDFGVAIGARDAHLTEVGHAVGTPGYLAPEILRGGSVPEPHHDIYAVGRLATALALGVEPRQPGEPADLSGFGPGPLRDAVAAFVAQTPAHRPQTAGDARAMLRAVAIDATPRTRDGDPVDVLDQLPPLSDLALAERDPHAATTPAVGTPDVGTPAVSTPAVSTFATAPVPAPPTARLAGGGATTAAQSGRPGRARRRRGVLLAVAGIVVAAGVVVPVALTVGSNGSSDGNPTGPSSTPGSSGTSSSPSSTSSRPSAPAGTAQVPDVALGQTCTFVDEGDLRSTADGTSVRCVRQSNGTYVWSRT